MSVSLSISIIFSFFLSDIPGDPGSQLPNQGFPLSLLPDSYLTGISHFFVSIRMHSDRPLGSASGRRHSLRGVPGFLSIIF